MNELRDEELKNVTGGAITGDVNDNGEVYFEIPVGNLSGWYNKTSLEKLCQDYSMYAALVKPYVNQNIRDAVKTLYGDNVPAAVKNMLG